MSFSQPDWTIRQSMHKILDQLQMDESDGSYEVTDDSAHITITNIDNTEIVDMDMTRLELIESVTEGFDVTVETEQDGNYYTVTILYNNYPEE